MSLWTLKEKENGFITLFDQNINKGHALRLKEIGLQKGTKVTCLKVLPFGGPRVFQISDSVFSLDKSIAHRVFIQKR